MSYSIELEEQVADRLRAVPRRWAARIVEAIDRLGETPSLGAQIPDGVLAGRMLYQFVVEPNPRVFRLAVLYKFSDDEQKIFITDLGLLRGDGSRLHLAENWPPD